MCESTTCSASWHSLFDLSFVLTRTDVFRRLGVWAFRRSAAERFDQRHFAAGHQLLDVHQDQHAAVDRAQSRQALGRPRRARDALVSVAPNSGAGMIWSGASVSTSDTPSTTIPTTRCATFRMMTTV